MAGRHEIGALVGRERVRILSLRRDGPGLAVLAALLALLVAGGVGVRTRRHEARVAVPMVLHGIVAVHLFAPFHETSRGGAFATRRLNDAVERFCGLALGLAPMRWLAWNMAFHAEHHAVPPVPFHALPELPGVRADRLVDIRRGHLATQRHLIGDRTARGG